MPCSVRCAVIDLDRTQAAEPTSTLLSWPHSHLANNKLYSCASVVARDEAQLPLAVVRCALNIAWHYRLSARQLQYHRWGTPCEELVYFSLVLFYFDEMYRLET
jgi:hypothetical protein